MKAVISATVLVALLGAYFYTTQSTSLENVGVTDTELIKQGEGLRLCTYKDSVGIKTVCYGFNLQRSNAQARVKAAGGNWAAIDKVGGCTTQAVCNKLLDVEIQSARTGKKNIFGAKSVGCANADAVLVDLTYNLGQGGLSQFKNFIANIKAKNWKGAASHLQSSLYCKQVGTRCTRNMNYLKGCK